MKNDDVAGYRNILIVWAKVGEPPIELSTDRKILAQTRDIEIDPDSDLIVTDSFGHYPNQPGKWKLLVIAKWHA